MALRYRNAITFCHLVPEVEIPFDIVLIMTWTSFMYIVELFDDSILLYSYNEDGKEDGDLLIRLVDMKKRIFLNFLKQASYPDVNNCLALLYRF